MPTDGVNARLWCTIMLLHNAPNHDHWVFAYGSLMWNPGFDYAERCEARLIGAHRALCVYSYHYRGTPEAPGLVLGLEEWPGHVCTGLALRVEDRLWPEVSARIRAREMVTEAYRETQLPLALADGRRVEALAYVMRKDHVQYCGELAPEAQAEIIAGAAGGRGPNAD